LTRHGECIGRVHDEEVAMERMEYEAAGAGNGTDMNEMKEAAAAKLEDVREWSADALERLESFVRERPGTAILAALGAGYLIGRIIRR
jgi:ElaB/YqjD/DUF883 family membrane-anchored ribosome-binding protein